MKQHLHTLFVQALSQLQQQGVISQTIPTTIRIERSRDKQYGDFACNAAMVLAKVAKMRPRDLAEQLVAQLPTDNEWIAKIEIAGPGFINVFLTSYAYQTVINEVLTNPTTYGQSQVGAGQTILMEYVSANPTGPLHVGHGRGAAYGAALANLLQAVGYRVHQEYYVNDAGRQMDILATSVWLRYLELCGESVPFPINGYHGDYIWDIAASLHREQRQVFHQPIAAVVANIPLDEPQGGDKEKHMDALIERSKQLLGEVHYQQVFQRGLTLILENIRRDLEQFGVKYDEWFAESSLTASDTVHRAIAQLQTQGHLYKQDGALWFRSSDFGDEKDRVVVRDNGQLTYFASDIAYHLDKLERGFNQLINIWGADHHGYIARIKAAMTALGANANQLTILLVQFATLYRGQERLQMSTRSGEFVTLRELREEVGRDAARFFYIQRKSEQHLDFDLDLAKSQVNANPVYYIQYAHARIASVFRELAEKNFSWNYTTATLKQLENSYEQDLMVTVSRYPEMIEQAAQVYEPHQLTYYLIDLAKDFHTYYNEVKFLVTDDELRNARLSLIAAVQQVLRNGLEMIGVSAPEVM